MEINLDNINYPELYKQLGVQGIKEGTSVGQYQALCPFHADTARSFGFKADTGQWHCFAGCGGNGGNIRTFLAMKYNIINDDVEGVLRSILEPIEFDIIKYHNLLLNNNIVLKAFMTERGISLETIKKYKIGFEGERFTFPIFIANHLVNVKFYKMGATSMKFYSYSKEKIIDGEKIKIGYGDRKLYPYENLFKGDEIFLFEGETDCLLANSLGLNAITNTTGAGSFNQNWRQYFTNKIVYICYDIDKPGKVGAEKVAMELRDFAKQIYIINLPISEPPNGDFTDYIVRFGHSIEDFKALITSAKPVEASSNLLDGIKSEPTKNKTDKAPEPSAAPIEENEPAIDTVLRDSGAPSNVNKKIRLQIIVSGKDLTPFIIPYTVYARCQLFNPGANDFKKRCNACSLSKVKGCELVKKLTIKDNVLLKLLMSNDFQNKGYIKEFMGIPRICPTFHIETIDNQNVEEIRAIPEIDFVEEKNTEYTTRVIYHVSTSGKRLRPNTSYKIIGVSMPKPQSQYSTIVFDKAEHKQTEIDNFEMTDKIKNDLKIFQAEDNKAAEKITEIHKQFTYNLTKIYGRREILMAIDLIYFSVLEFDFLDDYQKRGYVEGLIIGDTETGKSKTIERMREFYRLGEIISGKGATPAGLIGGLSSIAGRWHLQWGKYPLNDRRLLIIEELGGLTEEAIQSLTNVRSSGIAEIVRVITERTWARVRMLGIANPRTGDKVNNYNYGVLIVKALIGKTEDIRRFDFALIIAEGDVDLLKYDLEKLSRFRMPDKYTSSLNNLLLRWVWSRTRKHVKFLPETTKEILDKSKELAETYSSIIPLVAKGEQRIKLARLSASIAARVFSADETGENLIVKPEHTEIAYKYLRQIYDKPTMAYDLFSKSQNIKNNISEEETHKLIKEFKERFPNWQGIRDQLLDGKYFGKSELFDMVGFTKDKGSEFFKWCAQNRLIRGISGKYKTTPIFIKILKNKEVLEKNEAPKEAENPNFPF